MHPIAPNDDDDDAGLNPPKTKSLRSDLVDPDEGTQADSGEAATR